MSTRQTGVASGTILLLLVSFVGCPLDPYVPDDGTPPTREILDLEEAAFDLINQERVAEGLDSLVMNEDVRAVARAHSRDMVARDFFDHYNPDGDSPFDRLHAAGITYTMAGENIAWNNYPNPVTTAVDGWMDSPGHRANILTAGFTHTGMGVASDGDGGYYFTQLFVTFSKDGEAGPVFEFFDTPLAIPAE